MAEPDTVTVWRLALPSGTPPDRWKRLLSGDERQRADACSHPAASARFVGCRAALRLLLGDRLGLPPDQIGLTQGPHGKPLLADSESGLAFNLSHTENWALIALGHNAALGIDLEAHRTLPLDRLADRVLAPSERDWWERVPAPQKEAAFFRLWTRKEAFAKAVGRGIALGLQHIVFGPEGDLAAVPEGCGTPREWQVQDLTVADGYSAAVSARRPLGAVQLRDFVLP